MKSYEYNIKGRCFRILKFSRQGEVKYNSIFFTKLVNMLVLIKPYKGSGVIKY
jgi:hypothetical protein